LAARSSALVLAPEAPYPAFGGGALRTASLLEYLARKYDLDVILFEQSPAAHPAAARLKEITRNLDVIQLPSHRRHATARAVRNLGRLWRGVPPLTDRFSGFETEIARITGSRRYELAVVEHFWCAPYAPVLGAAGRLVLDLHNVESVLHGHCSRSERWPLSALHARFQSACLALERRWLPEFSRILTASDSDAARVLEIAPESRPAVYPNAIPLHPMPDDPKEDVIVFSGNLEYHPNTNAIAFFRDEIWPVLRERFPSLEWRLVGKNAGAVRPYAASDPRIQFTGPVDDAVREIARAKVAVVPLRAGSGTRIKILEAWAAGTPVVSTAIGAEGLAAVNGEHLLIADTAAEFTDATGRLLESPDLRERISSAARAFYEREFTWQAAWSKLAGAGI